MIDLADAYHRIDEMLAKHGRHESYCISLHVWNHRRAAAEIHYTVSVATTPQVLMAYQIPSIDDALAWLDGELTRKFRPTPGPTLDDAREVVTP